MRAYRIEVFIIDHDDIGEHEIVYTIENTKYPNHCIRPEVKHVEVRDIGAWTDDHPLNLCKTANAEYTRLFYK